PPGSGGVVGIRGAHRAHEVGDAGGILDALGRLHAAADIDGVGAHALNRASHVLRVQPTTQNDARSGACGSIAVAW
ncbi:hypothetical protein O6250_23660, partial [Salmonella enterica subsp. enterica]